MDNASQVAYGQQVPLDADANLVGVDDDAYQYNERDTQSGPGEHQQQQLVGGLPLCYDRTGTTSSYRGVCWHKKSRKWQAAINSSGRHVYLGSFETEEEAARMFDRVALHVRGHKAKLNFDARDYFDELGQFMTDTRLEALVKEAHAAATAKQQRKAEAAEAKAQRKEAALAAAATSGPVARGASVGGAGGGAGGCGGVGSSGAPSGSTANGVNPTVTAAAVAAAAAAAAAMGGQSYQQALPGMAAGRGQQQQSLGPRPLGQEQEQQQQQQQQHILMLNQGLSNPGRNGQLPEPVSSSLPVGLPLLDGSSAHWQDGSASARGLQLAKRRRIDQAHARPGVPGLLSSECNYMVDSMQNDEAIAYVTGNNAAIQRMQANMRQEALRPRPSQGSPRLTHGSAGQGNVLSMHASQLMGGSQPNSSLSSLMPAVLPVGSLMQPGVSIFDDTRFNRHCTTLSSGLGITSGGAAGQMVKPETCGRAVNNSHCGSMRGHYHLLQDVAGMDVLDIEDEASMLHRMQPHAVNSNAVEASTNGGISGRGMLMLPAHAGPAMHGAHGEQKEGLRQGSCLQLLEGGSADQNSPVGGQQAPQRGAHGGGFVHSNMDDLVHALSASVTAGSDAGFHQQEHSVVMDMMEVVDAPCAPGITVHAAGMTTSKQLPLREQDNYGRTSIMQIVEDLDEVYNPASDSMPIQGSGFLPGAITPAGPAANAGGGGALVTAGTGTAGNRETGGNGGLQRMLQAVWGRLPAGASVDCVLPTSDDDLLGVLYSLPASAAEDQASKGAMQPACGGPSNFLGSLHTRCGAVIAHGDTYNAKLASPGSVIRPGSLSLCELGSFSTPGDALQACQGALRLLKQTRGSVTPLLPLPAVAGGPGDVGHYGGGDMDTQSGEDGDCFPEPETSEDTQGPRVTYVQPSSSAAGPLGVLQGQHLPQASNLSNSNTSQGVTLQLFAPGAAPHVRYILRTACSNDTASTPPLNIAGVLPGAAVWQSPPPGLLPQPLQQLQPAAQQAAPRVDLQPAGMRPANRMQTMHAPGYALAPVALGSALTDYARLSRQRGPQQQ